MPWTTDELEAEWRMAKELASAFQGDFDDAPNALDILDALATVGLALSSTRAGVSSAAYFHVLKNGVPQ